MMCCKYIDIFSKNNLRTLFCLLACLMCASAAHPQKQSARFLAYIDLYKDIAIRHQQEYGIPASITLAQGLLESSAGSSYLSTRGNNHFGIKCHNWSGDVVTYDDTLHHECYRQYAKAEDSFADHARFLKGKRYAPLYQLDVTDYQGWAQGLKDCGYATDPDYPAKLTGIIEQYQLYNYDSGQPRMAKPQPLKPDPSIGHDAAAASGSEATLRNVAALHTVHLKWGLHCVKAQRGDTYQAIAAEFDIKPKKLLEFNDADPGAGPLAEGEMVWLEKKEKRAPMGFDTYTVRHGDSMRAIAQQFGIRLDNLLKLNKLPADHTPTPGTQLLLR